MSDRAPVEILLCKRLIDDGHLWTGGDICVGEFASADDRHPDRAEVVCADSVSIGSGPIVAHARIKRDTAAPVAAIEQWDRAEAYRPNAGYRRDVIAHFGE